ncbi:iron chaperone [Demequina sp.]|uniref:iron chaperone n=1 Tax=Demequina sp. TaxID=2050685 RepID=UPI003D14942D
MVATVAEYIEGFEGLTRERLEELRELVLRILPDAVEGVAYGIAGFKVGGKPVVYLGGFAKHVSVYPITQLPPALDAAVAPYRSGKGTAKFPNTEPLPRDLIEDLVRFMADRAAGA